MPGATGPVGISAIPALLALTWFDHFSAMIEVNGRRLLVDPM
jgi:L-ascorbate metabolism protein UlaG (beta-lactamase superfamily)